MTPANASNSLWRVLLPHTMGSTELPDAETTRAYKLAAADAGVPPVLDASGRNMNGTRSSTCLSSLAEG